MSIELLLETISATSLKDVAKHWNEARGSKRMPAWSDIKPQAIARHLPSIWSWKFDPQTGIFIGRLAGELIVNAFGESLRGKTGEEFFKDRGGDALIARHTRVVREPCFYHGSGSVFVHAHRAVQGERIIMPLSEDGITADGILGMTIYDVAEIMPQGIGDLQSEAGIFIPL